MSRAALLLACLGAPAAASWQPAAGSPFGASLTTTGQANAIAADPATGGAYAAGWQWNRGTGSARWHLVRKVDAAGGIVWTTTFTGVPSAGAEARGLAADAAGGVVVAGVAPPAGGTPSWLVNRYAPDGRLAWSRTYTSPAWTSGAAQGVAADGLPSQPAVLSGPWGVGIAAGSSLYIADRDNARLRVEDVAAGVIATAAGTGAAGFGGDGGPAALALVNAPEGVAVDAGGTVYLADTANHRVRKVDPASGVITTVAGTGIAGDNGDGIAATAAQLNGPRRVAVDAAGNLYLADTGNARVRRVDALTGIITTVAGTGTAGSNEVRLNALQITLAGPWGLAVDGPGDVWFIDRGTWRIRRVVASAGAVEPVAGTGVPGYNGDGLAAVVARTFTPTGAALDAAGNLYVADEVNHRIRRVDAQTGVISTVAGTGAAGTGADGVAATASALRDPTGVAVDASGNLWIAEFGNSRVRRVDAVTKTILTVAGTGALGFGGDGGSATAALFDGPLQVAVDAAGTVYVVDFLNQRLRRIEPVTWTITTVAGTGVPGYNGDGIAATGAELNYPYSVAVDAAGGVLVADAYNHRVRRVDPATGLIATVAGNGTAGFAGDGGAATAAEVFYPLDVKPDGAGDLLVADYGNDRIRRVDAGTGVISTLAGTGATVYNGDTIAATAALLNAPGGIACDGSASLFIADTGNHRILHVDGVTGLIGVAAGTGLPGFNGDGLAGAFGRLQSPDGITLNPANGNLLIADRAANRVRRLNAASGLLDTRAGDGTAGIAGDGGPPAQGELNAPADAAFDGGGNLYIADTGNHVVRKVDAATGLLVTLRATLGYQGAGGNLYVAGYGARSDVAHGNDWRLLKYDLSGTLLWAVDYDSPAHGDDQALAVAVDAGGSVFVAGYETRKDLAQGRNALLRKYGPNGALLWSTSYDDPGHGDDLYAGVASDPLDGSVVAAGWEVRTDLGQAENWLVRKYDRDGGLLWSVSFNGAGNAADRARGVAIDGAGNVIVAGEEHTAAAVAADWLVRAYDAAGNLTWSQAYDDPAGGSDSARGVAVDALGNALVAGTAGAGTPVPGLNWTRQGAWRVARYDAAGRPGWTAPDPLRRDDAASGLAVDARSWGWVAGTASQDDLGPAATLLGFSVTSTAGAIGGWTFDPPPGLGTPRPPSVAAALTRFGSAPDAETEADLALTADDQSSTTAGTAWVIRGVHEFVCTSVWSENLAGEGFPRLRAAAVVRLPNQDLVAAGTAGGSGPDRLLVMRWLRNVGQPSCYLAWATHPWTATWAAPGGAAVAGRAAASDGRGGVWVAAESSGDLLLFNYGGTAYADTWAGDLKMPLTAGFPRRVAVPGGARVGAAVGDSGGRVWIAGAAGGAAALWRFEPDGTPSPGFPAVFPGAPAFTAAAADAAGLVYAAGDAGAGVVFVAVDATGTARPGTPLTLARAPDGLSVAGLGVEPGGAVWLAATQRSSASTWSGTAAVLYRLLPAPDPPLIPPGTIALRAPGGAVLNLLRGEWLTILMFPLAPGDLRVSILTQRAEPVREFTLPSSGNAVVSVAWDGRNGAGEAVASGTYVVRVAGGGLRAMQRMVVIRR